jgi:IS5 family transposase
MHVGVEGLLGVLGRGRRAELYESVSMRRFAGIDLGHEPVPDETTVCRFGHLLEGHDVGRRLFEEVHDYLETKGLKIARGTKDDQRAIENRDGLHL